MRRLAYLISVLLLSVISLNHICAQVYEPAPVTVSTEKIRMDGQLYYVHKVVEKQTLYSIAKAYGVSTEDITAVNPELKDGGSLKTGSTILIPASPVSKQADAAAEAKKENVQAPSNEKDSDRFDGIDYFTHKVKWYENLQSIAKKYGVSQELIIEFNNLESIYVKKRQILKIPDPEFIARAEALVSGEKSGTEETAPASDTEEKAAAVSLEEPENLFFNSASPRGAQVTISLVLPLECSLEGSGGNTNYMDFYSGALLAAKSLNDRGIKLEINVIDTQEYNSSSDIAESGILDGSAYVIGPVHAREIAGMLPYCKRKGIATVSPLDHKALELAYEYDNLVQIPVSAASQFNDIASWINEDKAGGTVLVLSEVGGTGGPEKEMAENALARIGMEYKTFSYNILQGRGVEHSISGLLDINAVNHIVIASENEAFVNDAIRNINTLCTVGKYNIRTYGTAKVRSFETIETEHFHNVNLHLSMGYYVDYNSRETMRFLGQYRAVFNTEPSPFAFQGYDAFMFFATVASLQNGPEPIRLEDMPCMRLLQSDMKFERVSENGGYENKAARRIVFLNDYTVKLVEGSAF